MLLRRILFIFFITLSISVDAQDQTKLEEIKPKKQLNFIFISSPSNTELDSVVVLILKGTEPLQTFNTGANGKLTMYIEPGTYVLSINRVGYSEKVYKEFKVHEKGVGIFRINLSPNY